VIPVKKFSTVTDINFRTNLENPWSKFHAPVQGDWERLTAADEWHEDNLSLRLPCAAATAAMGTLHDSEEVAACTAAQQACLGQTEQQDAESSPSQQEDGIWNNDLDDSVEPERGNLSCEDSLNSTIEHEGDGETAAGVGNPGGLQACAVLAPGNSVAEEEGGGGGRLHKLMRQASKLSADPLMFAACMNELRAMHENLNTLEWERELSCRDDMQRTPLSLAICGGNTEVSSRGSLKNSSALVLPRFSLQRTHLSEATEVRTRVSAI